MLGHNVLHVPMDAEVERLPWFTCDKGVRRLAWAMTALLGGYWGWFLYNLALAQNEGWVVPKVLVGMLPVAAVAWAEAVRPRAGAAFMVASGLAAAVFTPMPWVAPILLGLSLLAGGLMYASSHR